MLMKSLKLANCQRNTSASHTASALKLGLILNLAKESFVCINLLRWKCLFLLDLKIAARSIKRS